MRPLKSRRPRVPKPTRPPRTTCRVRSDKRRHASLRMSERVRRSPRGRTSTDQRGLAFALRRRRAAVFLTCREGERGHRQRCKRLRRLPALLRGCSTSSQARHGPRQPHEAHKTSTTAEPVKTKRSLTSIAHRASHPGPLRFFCHLRINQRNGREPRGLPAKPVSIDCEAKIQFGCEPGRLDAHGFELDRFDRLQMIGQPRRVQNQYRTHK